MLLSREPRITQQRAENHAAQSQRIGGGLHGVQGQHGVVLSLGEAIAVLEMEFVGSGIDTLAFGDACVAVLVDDEHVQQRRGGDIRLMAEFGELGFDGRIGDADGGPVVKELAGRGMLGDGFERGAGIVVDGLVLELTDGAAAQKSLDCCVGNHGFIVARQTPDVTVDYLTVKCRYCVAELCWTDGSCRLTDGSLTKFQR